jgi:hypothetical protein
LITSLCQVGYPSYLTQYYESLLTQYYESLLTQYYEPPLTQYYESLLDFLGILDYTLPALVYPVQSVPRGIKLGIKNKPKKEKREAGECIFKMFVLRHLDMSCLNM